MTDIKHVPNSPKINLMGLVDDEYAEGVIFANQILRNAFLEQEEWMCCAPCVYLPFEWGNSDGVGGPAVTDPLTIYIGLPLSGYENQVTFSVTMSEIIADIIEDADHAVLPPIAKALRKLADVIDGAYDPARVDTEE